MTTLANANLLDDSVPNSGSLKSQRLNRTAQSATNPNPVAKVAKVQEEEFDEEDDYEYDEVRNEPQRSYSSNKSNSKASVNSDADEKKIMGMNPALFYTLLGFGVLVGGYFAYTKFFKGKKGGLSDAGIPATGGGTPEIKL